MSAISSAEVTTNARTTSTSVIMTCSETFRPQQRVGQVEQQAERDDAGERVIEDHGYAPLQAFAGIGIANARHNEAEAERQHDNVHHGMFLCDPSCEAEQTAVALAGLRCHPTHRFSRREQRRRYRNLIKVPLVPGLNAQPWAQLHTSQEMAGFLMNCLFLRPSLPLVFK